MPGLNPSSQDFDHFIEITGANRQEAAHFLEDGISLQGAIEDYFAAHETQNAQIEHEDASDRDNDAAVEKALMSDNENSTVENPKGPRTLGGASAETTLPEGWGQPQKRTGRIGEWSAGGSSRKPGEVATLFNTGSASGPSRPMPGAFDDDEDDDDERKKGETFYTGGEKSGLAVENPDQPGGPRGHRDMVRDILRQAADNAPPEQSAAPSAFRGAGNTLGSDDTPSTTIPDPSASQPQISTSTPGMFDRLLGAMTGREQAPPAEEEVQTRQLTFWRNGFSIEDGPLMEYDAPGNREILQALKAGRAPPSLFNVRYNQPLQVEVAQRTNEDYVQQKKKARMFGGEGNRLGSVTPEVRPSSPVGPARQPVSAGGSTGNTPKFEIDETKPTTSIQVRLADGSKLVAKVNLDHTVGDLRNYVAASNPASRSFILQTTFPSKELSDEKQTIEAAGLKNAVVVQRWA